MENKTEQNNKEQEVKKGRGKTLFGNVVSDKMEKTAVVEVNDYKRHPRYLKFTSAGKKYKVHDEENVLNIGDRIEIIETNPMSKDKRFTLSRIIDKAVIVDLNEDNDDGSEDSNEENK